MISMASHPSRFTIATIVAASFTMPKRQRRTGSYKVKLRYVSLTLPWLIVHSGTPDIGEIDAEGLDLKVLEGAAKTLRENGNRFRLKPQFPTQTTPIRSSLS